MFTDRKPRELLKQYSRISIVDGTSLQANLNRQQSFKSIRNAPNPCDRTRCEIDWGLYFAAFMITGMAGYSLYLVGEAIDKKVNE